MVNFVDLHCHALYGVDDGSATEQEMYTMLSDAYSDGTRIICFTPHFKTYEFHGERDIRAYRACIERHFGYALNYAKDNLPELKLFLGNEIMYHGDIADSIKNGFCSTLAGGSYILLEFRPDTPAFEITDTVSKLLRKGFRPLIAHIERYNALVKSPALLNELKEMGALFQVNAGSITKFKIGKTAKFIKYLLKKSLVDVIASDAHGSTGITPCLSDAYSVVCKRCGEKYATRFFRDNPLSIINNENIF